METNFKRINLGDRREIQKLMGEGISMRRIAIRLGKVVSSISAEINNNKVNGIYDAEKADAKSKTKRRNANYKTKKIVGNRETKEVIEKYLMEGQSPENIALRMKVKHSNLIKVSKSTIYEYINSIYGVKIWNLRKKLSGKKKRRGVKVKLTDRTFITKRPEYINRRIRIGDTEADFIVSGRDGHGVLLVIVDRKTRYAYLKRILNPTCNILLSNIKNIQKEFKYMKTLTTDNDILFQKFKEIETELSIKIYFCEPYKPWQKGSVENVNKYIRKFIPKGSDLSTYSEVYIQEVERILNNRIMKILGGYTPKEEVKRYGVFG
jgi:transposase, IS30 family